MTAIFRIGKADLQSWLESFGFNDIIGNSKIPWDCPISNYLKDIGMEDPHVVGTMCCLVEKDTCRIFLLESWCQEFITEIDKSFTREITASQALHVLATISGHQAKKRELPGNGFGQFYLSNP